MLVLGASGAAFAKWCDQVVVKAEISTGEVDVEFSHQMGNDWPGDYPDPDMTQGDPAECGVWEFPDLHDPYSWVWRGGVQPEMKEVASTVCEIDPGDPDIMRVTVTNGYPCYWGDIAFTLDNKGTIPVHIAGLRLVEVDGPDSEPFVVDAMLGPAMTWLVDADEGELFDLSTVPADQLHGFIMEHGIDFSVHLSELAICQQFHPEEELTRGVGGEENGSSVPGDICVHVEQAAQQGVEYTFEVQIAACQWNEVPCGGPLKVMPDMYDGLYDLTWSYPGSAPGSYFNITLAAQGPPAEPWFPPDGTYNGWCMNPWVHINHNAKAVFLGSTLDPTSSYFYDPAWRKVNWLLNNVPRVYDGMKLADGTYTWGPLQRAIWYLVGEAPYTPDAGDTAAWALINAASYHGDYIPGSGMMHAVICSLETGSGWQPLFVEVDP